MHDIDFLVDNGQDTSCGRERANDHGALLADWHCLRSDLQRSHSDLMNTAESHDARGFHVEAARVRNQATGVMDSIRRMDTYRPPAVTR